MKRVREYAQRNDSHAYRPKSDNPSDELSKARNRRWIKDMKRQGRDVIDIGPDFPRRRRGVDPSDWYGLERQETKDYAGYTRVWERIDKMHGWVSGFDRHP